MKLQQLIIKNLASIEEATIDFEQGPLAEESIFLICGETGAGKSTILDAICLALYNDTPRMQRSPKEKYMDLARSFSDKKEEINIDDVRQLMRRNTAEAWVELSFIGSNEIPYLARWYVAKARKKVDGNIQKVAWTLTNRKTGEELKKVKEVEDEIQRCIGLNFEQFCRTTLLAQGEFTRFLQSREADKSEILEKLTGTDIYSRIGMKIYDITKQKKEAYDLQHQRIAATHLLSEEEKEMLCTSLEQLKQDSRQQEAIAKELNRKHEWLRQELEYHKTRQEHQIQLEAIESRIHSDEYREQSRLIQEWDVTTDARKLLKENKERQEEITRQMQEEQQYLQQFIRLSEGMLQEEEKIRGRKYNSAVPGVTAAFRQHVCPKSDYPDAFAEHSQHTIPRERTESAVGTGKQSLAPTGRSLYPTSRPAEIGKRKRRTTGCPSSTNEPAIPRDEYACPASRIQAVVGTGNATHENSSYLTGFLLRPTNPARSTKSRTGNCG